MPPRSRPRELLFLISDVARLLRTCADHRARQHGMTRAQWAVLLRLERHEGLKQSDLADLLDIQPITLTRLVDRLCDNGLIERRADPNDRRAKRLYLTAAARPLLDQVTEHVEELGQTVLQGMTSADIDAVQIQLSLARENLKAAIGRNGHGASRTATEKVKHYG
jgi:MarR family transcriptional regulator for hemolysin